MQIPHPRNDKLVIGENLAFVTCGIVKLYCAWGKAPGFLTLAMSGSSRKVGTVPTFQETLGPNVHSIV